MHVRQEHNGAANELADGFNCLPEKLMLFAWAVAAKIKGMPFCASMQFHSRAAAIFLCFASCHLNSSVKTFDYSCFMGDRLGV